MQDPDYQAGVMKILQNPKMGQKLLELVDTQPVRTEMKKVMLETFESPLVQARLQDMLKKAAHDEIDQSLSKKSKKASSNGEEQVKGSKTGQ